MPCFHPIRAYRHPGGAVSFSERSLYPIDLPCGRCDGCLLERSRQWAIRCMHEAQLHEVNCFVTLTYAEDPVTLNHRDFQLFMKRLRKGSKKAIRYFMCGEYGAEKARPHYHAIFFGIDFLDKQLYQRVDDVSYYKSEALTKCWGLGDTMLGDVSFKSAGYVARYSLKKVRGDGAEDFYTRINSSTGEIVHCIPEYCRMSLRPGIGAKWYDKFHNDVYPDGMVVVNGVRCQAPKFYDRKFKKEDPEGFEELELQRELYRQTHIQEYKPERLLAKERVLKARTKSLKRS